MAVASSTLGLGVVVNPPLPSPAPADQPEDVIVVSGSAEEAEARQEMFLAGAVNGGVARTPVDPTESLTSQASAVQYPDSWTVTELTSPIEVKKWWLYSEWSPHCQFHAGIQQAFPNRATLHPETGDASIELIESTFHKVRGQYMLWQEPKENAKWIKAVVEKLELSWVNQHLTVCYPFTNKFQVTELKGLVLWKRPDAEKYDLIEGNHRVSAWKLAGEPPFLPCLLFIGMPQ